MTANMIPRNRLGKEDTEDDMNSITVEEIFETTDPTDWDKEVAIS